MVKHVCILFMVLALWSVSTPLLLAQSSIGIIPQPQEIRSFGDTTVLQGAVTIGGKSRVSLATMQYLRNALMDRHDINSRQADGQHQIDIDFVHTQKSPNEEYYELIVQNGQIKLLAQGEKGYFNAINSLLQLLSFHGAQDAKAKIPNVHIIDEPLFSWRGFMLDESRHFFGKEKVKQLLDWMAFYKLNKFHWHLTDEPAWRIEIKKYPMLGLVGGIGEFTNPTAPVRFYTQEDIKEIVSYAADRQIDIIPEIDMPGHATAANRAYPQFSGGGNPRHPDFTFHPGKEGTYQYLTNILKEVNVLFPSGIIHLGGDEVSYGNDKWDTDTLVTALKEKHQLKNNAEVEAYFMRRMADSVYHLGSKVAVWDEMADSGLPTQKSIQFWWRHDQVAQLDLALNNDYPVVICPRIPFYFDFVQQENHQTGRKWSSDYSSLQQVYDYDFEALIAKQKYPGQIMGAQANLWTEAIPTQERVDFMVFPRIAALAETVWTKAENKDFRTFQEVLASHLVLYKEDNIYFYDPFNDTNPEPRVKVSGRQYLDNPE